MIKPLRNQQTRPKWNSWKSFHQKKLIEYSNINFHENIAEKKILKAPRRWFAVEFSTLSAQQELFTRVEIIFLRFSILIHGKHATENFPPRYYNSTVINETQVLPKKSARYREFLIKI